MKSIFKRLICICMVVLLCFSSISILNAFADEEPALSKRCKTLIDASGNEDINFGDKPSDIRSRSHKKLSSAIDLSTADVFELDVYIQDINALKTVMPETSKLNFCFSSSTHKTNYNTKYAIANISEQLISSGWNHIEIKKSDFTESSIVWTGVLHYYLKFSDETFDMPAGLKNKEVKIRNICESYDIPVVTDSGVVLPDSAVFGTLGDNAEATLSSIGNTFSVAGTATDISDATFVKVDLLIPSFTEFNTFVSNKDFKFVLSSESGSATAIFGGAYFPSAVSGWYTVQLPVSDFVKSESFDFSAVTGFKIEITDDNDSALGDAYALKFGFSNVRGFSVGDYPEGDIFFGKTVADYAVSKQIVEFGNTFGDFAFSKSSDFTALSDAENIEFYIYVQELDNFKNFFKYDRSSSPVTASFDLTLSQGANTIKWTGIEEKVITSGWNHIILPVADANNSGFDVNTKFDKIKFDVSGVDSTDLSNNYGSFVIIEKLLATKGTAAKGELEFEKTQILSNGKSYKLGDTFVALSEKLEASVDSTGTKFIEFDIFVQNAETFKTIMGENGVTGISLCLSSTDNDDFTKNSLSTKISEKISKNGWNHIAVPFRNFKNGTAIETFDETAVTAWSILFNSTSVSSTGALEGQLLSIENITLTDVIDPVIPSTADPVISQEGKSGIYGDKYSDTLENSRIILENPVDITLYSKLQFDFYVEDYEAFTKMLAGTSNKLRFGLGTSEDVSKNIALYDFTDQVTGKGWNRIVLANTVYTKQNGDPDLKTVYNAFLTFGTDSSANPYGSLFFDFKNICSLPHERDVVPEPPEYIVDIWKEGKADRWGDQYVNAKMTFRKDLSSSPVDVTDIDLIEFDIYIEDYESFVSMAEIGSLYFVLGSNADDFNKEIARYSFTNQITHDGWNHIAIFRSSYVSNWDTDFNNIRWVYLTLWSGSVQYSPNPIGDTILRIVNIVGTYAEYRKTPALPDDVVAVLGDEEGVYFAGNTVGQKYHFTLDRIYKEKFDPIDFSKTNKIEFDVYIDDYEKLLAAENDPTNERESKLAFVVSSTKPFLWGQYSAPRAYFSSSVLIADHVKHSGWNHVVVGKQDFVAFNNGGVDWSTITAFMVYYRSSSNYYPYDNHYSDLYVKVGNIVNTGIYVEVPKDGEKQEYVDKSAVYITNLDVLADENGAWNLMDGGVSTDYKTEGKGSILQTVNYTHTTDNTKMLYIFDETADMSDLKTLKFDFFVDIPSNIQRPGNNIQIILANDRFVKTDYCYWDLDLSSLKSGWNSIELPISKVKQVGNVDVAGVKVFMLRFNKLNLDKENFAVVLYGLDNLRYISSTGSTTLKINTFDEDDFEDDFDDMFDDEFDDEFDDIDDLTDVDVKGDTIYKKTVERIKVIDYTMIIIALAAEAAAIIIGLVIFTIIYEKKHKKNI